MPGRWESSGRPLFVRTVWIKGIRHVVLSKNDPLLREMVPDIPFRAGHVSAPTSEPALLPSPISAPSMTSACSSALTSSTEPLPESLLLNRCQKTEQEPVDEEDSPKTNKVKKYSLLGRTRWGESARGRQLFLPIDEAPATVELNPLSDRVMKWLDLSGKSLLETTMVDEQEKGKRWRGGRHVKKFVKNRSASLNIINTQYDMTLTADMRIEGNPQQKHHQTIQFERNESEKDMGAKMSRVYELKRSNSVIPLPVSPDCPEPCRPTTTDVVTKTKLHVFVPLITEIDSLSEENEGYF